MIKQVTFGLLALLASATPALSNTIISSPQRFGGGRVNIQTQTGTSCSSTAPDRASIGFAAGHQDNGHNHGFGNGGSSGGGLTAGVYVSMPFGGQPTGDCRIIIEMEQQRARLDMAVTLFEAGAMTQEELQEVADSVKRTLNR